MPEYREHFYQSSDDLQLYARDYACIGKQRGVILCMHGLTRNSADFEPIIDTLRAHHRVITADQRGRGRSAYDPNPANYNPTNYVTDMFSLLDSLELKHVILFGTSMGGLMAVMMKAIQPERFTAMIINDICADINPAGLQRIMSYVGTQQDIDNWSDAVVEVKRLNAGIFPNMDDAGWLAFAQRIFIDSPSGGLQLNYDPAIRQPLAANQDNAAPPDLWPVFQAASDSPIMLIHGELSDLLVQSGVDKFKSLAPNLNYLKVKGVGHAPLLDEPEVAPAVKQFLADLA
jgi:pimeloyl-ACP methyl ester carboxylesterase